VVREDLAMRIWARLWAAGTPALMNAVLDNGDLFNGYERLIQEIRCAILPGGRFADVVANLRIRGSSEAAGELEALAASEGVSTSPEILRSAFSSLLRPRLCERIQSLLLRQTDNTAGSSIIALKCGIDEILLPALEIYRDEEDEGKDGEATFLWGNREEEPEVEDPEAIVPGMLFPGVTFVSGRWKECHKTTFIGSLIMHVNHGLPFLGREVRQMKCSFVQLDTPLPTFLQMMRGIREGSRTDASAVDIPERSILGVRRALDLTQTESREWLMRYCEDEKVELLVIDSRDSVFKGDENDAEQVRPFMREFLCAALRDRLGVNVVLLAHPNRSGTSTTRGSGEWEAAADSTWKLRAKKQGERTSSVDVFISGRHAMTEFSFAVDYLESHGGGVRIREVAKDTRDPVLESLGEEWLSTSEIAECAKRSRGVTKAALGRLLSQGLVVRRNHPQRDGDQWRSATRTGVNPGSPGTPPFEPDPYTPEGCVSGSVSGLTDNGESGSGRRGEAEA